MFRIEGRPTRARGINNAGLITGFHTDATGRVATFVAQSGGYQLLYINASDDTIGEAINDAGQVSGLFSTPGPASTTHGFIATPAALPVGTTASGAYVFSVDVVANTPIFIDPEVALGYDYRTGHGDPNFVTVRLPIGLGDNQYVLTVGGHSYPLAAATHGCLAPTAARPVGTTASVCYVFSVDVVANTPVFIDPEVALGYDYRTGHGDPNFVTVRLPIGIGDNQYVLTVCGHSYPLAAGELFDFRTHGHADGVDRKSTRLNSSH